MKYFSSLLLALCFSIVAFAETTTGNEAIFSPKYIKQTMKQVADWQLNNPVGINVINDNAWARSAFYTGIMATYQTTKDKKYLNEAIRWSASKNWSRDKRLRHADDHVCGQTYLEIYKLKKKPEMLAPIRGTFDTLIANPVAGRKDWWWCDALFMAPPVLARLGKLTGDEKYYNFLHTMWWDATDFLFDKDENLYYRDKGFIGVPNKNGNKTFWSRGNGWVMGGTVRVLQYLPKTDPNHKRYVELLQKMAATIARVQREDGLWSPSLYDGKETPFAESSGSGFFCYAISWGINNGYLEREKYLPVVQKAWTGLTKCVHPDGKLGSVQRIGHAPDSVTPDDNQEYGSGAFLLAASEVIKLKIK